MSRPYYWPEDRPVVYCDDCADEEHWPIASIRVPGRCERCGAEREVNDFRIPDFDPDPDRRIPPRRIEPPESPNPVVETWSAGPKKRSWFKRLFHID